MKKISLALIVGVIVALGWFGTARATPPSGVTMGNEPPAVTNISAWLNVPCMDRCTGCDRCNNPSWGAENHVHFGPLMSANKVVVVQFWNTSLPVDTINKLNAFWQSNKSNVQVIGVVVTDDTQTEEQVRAFVAEKVRFPVGITSNKEILTTYGVTNMPHAVVVGRNGKCTWQGDPLEPNFKRNVDLAGRAPSLPGLPGRR
jgi:hypothetical protein